VVTCEYCRPHADPRKQRLCYEGERLFAAYREAGERYAKLSNEFEPPTYGLADAKAEMTNARRAYRAHTDGETT
jgi:hypothetical protein